MLRSSLFRRLVAAIPLLVPPTGSPAQEPPAATKPQIVHLFLSETRALAMLRIGTAPPVPVVFDTGTNGNLIDTGLADRLGLPNTGPSPSIDGSTGKPVAGHDSFIRDARLGGVAIQDARATALAYDQTDEVGIFGPNSFPESLVEMDGPRSRLVIRRRTPDAVPASASTPYLGSDGDALPSAVLDFGGLKVPAILDSGNDAPIILPAAFKDRLALESAPKPVGFAVSAGGRQPIMMARLAGSVRIGGVTVVKPKVYFMEGGRPNIGLPILRRITVVYDHGGARSWIVSQGTVTP